MRGGHAGRDPLKSGRSCAAASPVRSGLTICAFLSLLLISGCAVLESDDESHTDPVPVAPAEESGSDLPQRTGLAQALSDLERGRFDQAWQLLEQLNERDSGSAIVRKLLAQLEQAPEELLPGPYSSIQVAPGESLSEIANRELGDPLMFVALARLNEIPVPMQVAVGTVLRLPASQALSEPDAKPPLVDQSSVVGPIEFGPADAPPAEELAENRARDLYQQAVFLRREGQDVAALEIGHEAVAAEPGFRPAAELVDQLASEVTERMHGSALTAWRNRDVDRAIRLWQTLLEVVPDFEPARIYLQRAVELRARLDER